VNHRGCPTTSLQEAREWRECYASTRPPTNQKSIARQTEEHHDNNLPETGGLIPLAAAKDIGFCGYDTILALVLELPKNVATQCNPGNPQIAFAVLESECMYILCKAYEAYAAWSKVGLHISTATDAE
jgi:hypothetical protein